MSINLTPTNTFNFNASDLWQSNKNADLSKPFNIKEIGYNPLKSTAELDLARSVVSREIIMINGDQFVLAKTPDSEYSISLEAELDNMIANKARDILGVRADIYDAVYAGVGGVNRAEYGFEASVGSARSISSASEAYINDYAFEDKIDTKYGKAQVFLDLKGDNDSLGVGTLKYNQQLFLLDSDGNALLDARDEYFDKLKIRAYDENGDEIIMKLSDVMSSFDLKDFIRSKDEAMKVYIEEFVNKSNWSMYKSEEEKNKVINEVFDTFNPYGNFNANNRYEKIDESDIEKLKSLAGSDGWIDITKMANDKVHPWGYEKLGLAFESVGIDGKVRLSELGGDIKNAYVGVYMDNFGKTVSYFGLGGENFSDNLSAKVNEIYTNYMKEYNSLKDFFASAKGYENVDIMDFKNTKMMHFEKEFEALTGVDFSLDNLKELKRQSDSGTLASTLINQDYLQALKVNDNGTFTLRFASGAELVVSELFKDSGGLLDNESLAINADDFSQEELNNIIVSLGTIIDDKNDGKAISLKELGINAIEKLSDGKFLLKGDEQSYKVSDLYFMRILDDKEPSKSENSMKFYPKPVDILA